MEGRKQTAGGKQENGRVSRRAAVLIGSVFFFLFSLKKQHDPTHTFTEMRLEVEEVVVGCGG